MCDGGDTESKHCMLLLGGGGGEIRVSQTGTTLIERERKSILLSETDGLVKLNCLVNRRERNGNFRFCFTHFTVSFTKKISTATPVRVSVFYFRFSEYICCDTEPT